jgi:hypothetical protein
MNAGAFPTLLQSVDTVFVDVSQMNTTVVIEHEPEGMLKRTKSKGIESTNGMEFETTSNSTAPTLSYWEKIRLMNNWISFWSLLLGIGTLTAAPATILMIVYPETILNLSDNLPIEILKETRRQTIRFSIWLTFAWISFLLVHFGLLVFPGMVVSLITRVYGECSEKVRNKLQYIPALGMFLPMAITCIVSVIIYRIVFFQLPNVPEWRDFFNAHLMVMVFSLMFLAQRIFVQKIAFDFHKVAYKERLKQSKKALQVLENLRKAILKLSLFDFESDSDETNSVLQLPDPVSDDDGPQDFHKQNSDRIHSTSQPCTSPTLKVPGSRTIAREPSRKGLYIGTKEEHKPNLTSNLASDSYAIRLADKLFASLQKEDGEIHEQEFLPFFDTKEEAKEAFSLFDKDGNGSVNLNELRWAVMRIYREKRSLATSMVDLSHALGNLNRILYVLTVITAILICFPIYGISINAILPFTSVLVALSFIFGSSGKAI